MEWRCGGELIGVWSRLVRRRGRELVGVRPRGVGRRERGIGRCICRQLAGRRGRDGYIVRIGVRMLRGIVVF